MTLWMVRAGEGSTRAAEFERTGYVGIGWEGAGDFTPLTTREAVQARIDDSYPNATAGHRANSAGQAHRFRNVIQRGDRVVTYDGTSREYLLGTIVGDYQYTPGVLPGFDHVRRVEWSGRVPKDALDRSTINSLGAMMTLFSPGPEVLSAIEQAARGDRKAAAAKPEHQPRSGRDPFPPLFAAFVTQYLATEQGERHRAFYDEGARVGRESFRAIVEADARGEDITAAVLSRILPHTDSRAHRENGDWVHIAPAITKDIRTWYDAAGWTTPDQWPAKARLIFDFVKRVTEDPEALPDACRDFAADPLSKGLQGGMISPILNALVPERFAVVNSKVVKTMERMTGQSYRPAIADYPATNAAVFRFVERQREVMDVPEAHGIPPLLVFDIFAHWLIAVRDESVDDAGAEDEGEETSAPRSSVDRASALGARRALESICPDPAPRAVALEVLAEMIREANRVAPESWSITLHPSLVRLNVGGLVMLDITRRGMYSVVYGPSLSAESRALLEPYAAEAGFRSIPEAEAFLIPYDRMDPAGHALRQAAYAVIKVASDRVGRTPYKSSHSQGVLAHMRELGIEVPDPPFVTRGGRGVDEPMPPDYSAGDPTRPRKQFVHPVVSIEDIEAETGIAASTIAGWISAINRKGQAIVYGPPGTGKTWTAERLARHLVSGGDGMIELVQFHPAYAYEDFIQGLRPVADAGGRLRYEMVPGRFLEFCRVAAAREGTSVLIIDEINRANLSQVFGELMYLLEYRDREVPLAGGGHLRIPANVRIIGTMNTADRSIALVDHALRRRFAFIRLGPDFEVLRRFHAAGGRDVDGLVDVLEQVNRTIGNPHYAVGISYFMRESLEDDLEAIWRGEIEPYLEEIFFDRPDVAEELRWSAVRGRISR